MNEIFFVEENDVKMESATTTAHTTQLSPLFPNLGQDPAPMILQFCIGENSKIYGGSPVILGTRVRVYDIAALKVRDVPDEEILRRYPSLSMDHIAAAWEYYQLNPEKVEASEKDI